jgi:transposase-like protein
MHDLSLRVSPAAFCCTLRILNWAVISARLEIEEEMMRDLVKCPSCRSPLERWKVSDAGIEYRCTVCGKRTVQEVSEYGGNAEVSGDSVVELED